MVVEVVETADGTEWVVPALRRMVAKRPGIPVYADGLTCASIVAELRRDATVDVQVTGPGDMARACSVISDLTNSGNIRHRPNEALDAAVVGAATRKSQDGWAWSRRGSGVDISALVAASLGVYGAMSQAELVKPGIAYSGG